MIRYTGQPDMDDFINEAATSVNAMTELGDLDRRIAMLRERCGVAEENMATFIVHLPSDYNNSECLTMIHMVTSAMNQAVTEAKAQVAYERMWRGETAA